MAQPIHHDRRKVNVKLISLGVLALILVVFALLNRDDVGVDWIIDTWSAPLIVVILLSAVIGFAIGYLVKGHRAARSARSES